MELGAWKRVARIGGPQRRKTAQPRGNQRRRGTLAAADEKITPTNVTRNGTYRGRVGRATRGSEVLRLTLLFVHTQRDAPRISTIGTEANTRGQERQDWASAPVGRSTGVAHL